MIGPITFTPFRRVTDIAIADPQTMPWPALVARLSKHERTADKRAVSGWSPATFQRTCSCGADNCPGPRGHRLTDNVIAVHAAVFDIDKRADGTPLDGDGMMDVIWRLNTLDVSYLLHSTHSHTVDKPALRGVLPLSQSVSAERWPAVYSAIARFVGFHVEPACCNPDRFWYWPSTPPGGESWSKSEDGKVLDVDAIMAAAPAPTPAPRPAPRLYTRKPGDFDARDAIRQWCPGATVYTRRGLDCWDVECPQEHLHTPGSGGKHATVASVDVDGKPGFNCKHGHCTELHWKDFRKHHDPDWIPFDERPIGPPRSNREAPDDDMGESPIPPIPPIPPDADVPHAAEADAAAPPERERYRLTDIGNAQRFARAHGHRLRFVQAWQQWLVWDGRRWCADELGAEMTAAKTVAESLYTEAASMAQRAAAGDEQAGALAVPLAKWACASSKAGQLRSMLALAQSEEPIAASRASFDRDPFALNVLNGTIDLRIGDLRPHRQSDMITKLAPVAYTRDAAAPRWDAFLERVLPDAEVRAFVQRFVGYCLTGDVGEQMLLFAFGYGANGKSVLLDVVLALLGDYALRAAPDLVLAKQGEAHPTEQADLEGRRFVVCSEIDQGRVWNEALIKRITGDTTITARKMRQDFYTFQATHKLVVAANTRPTVRGTDDGIWRRMRLVPFGVTIPASERDKGLVTRLLDEELPGILAWAMRGCLAWQRAGVGEAEAVTEATESYRAEQDVLGLWIGEECVLLPSAFTPTASLYDSFVAWCEKTGRQAWKRETMRARLLERPGLAERRTTAARGIDGIGLVSRHSDTRGAA